MKVTNNMTDKNPNSRTTSQKSTPSRTNNRISGIEMRKTSTRGSNDGGDKDPPRKVLKNLILHILLSKEKEIHQQ
jgi:hypothetical protein